MQELEGRVAVVTGAASGIGRALARCFAAERMRVVLADVERAPLDKALAELRELDADAIAVPTDVSVADEMTALAERVTDAYGAVHVVCHNAGVFSGGIAWETPLEDYAWVFDVNIRGVIHGVRSFTPLQIAHGEPGHIVITASTAAITSMPFCAPYTMSKHAVLALAESLCLELSVKKSGVGVSVLCPEVVATGIFESERNRQERYKRDGDDAMRGLFEGDVVQTAIDPDVIAARTLAAIREDRFYILPPEPSPWRRACEARHEAIRTEGRPPLTMPPSD